MNRLDPQEELAELDAEIAVKQYTAARMMRDTHALIDELNQMKEDREVVAQYVRDHPPKPQCSVAECDGDVRALGLCWRHYKRQSRGVQL